MKPGSKKRKTAKIDEDHDISEQERAEEALRQSEERYRSLVTAMAQIVWTTNAQGEVTEDIPTWRDFTGQSEEEIKGWGWINALHPEDRERTEAIWSQAVENRTLYDTEYRVRRYDGEYRYVAARGVPVLEKDGSIREWIGTCIDITESKRADEQLRESELRFRSVVQSTPDAIILADGDGNIIFWNNSAKIVFGYEEEEVLGKPLTILMPEHYRDAHLRGLERVRSTGETYVGKKNYVGKISELRGLRKDGSEFPIELSRAAWKIGDKMFYSGHVRDITERKHAEEQLRRAHQELEVRVQERTAELTKAMELLKEQQKAFVEVSVPVVKVWNRILLVPLIGVFDSQRAELLMETLLTELENTQAKVAILDVSGIPIVDSLVAKHLIRTVSAVKLMGAECIVTGIRSRISQTIVQLGIDLSGIITRTALAEGIKVAFDLTDQKIVSK